MQQNVAEDGNFAHSGLCQAEELDAWMCQAQQEDDADAFARLG